jgi:hypothetical protein
MEVPLTLGPSSAWYSISCVYSLEGQKRVPLVARGQEKEKREFSCGEIYDVAVIVSHPQMQARKLAQFVDRALIQL